MTRALETSGNTADQGEYALGDVFHADPEASRVLVVDEDEELLNSISKLLGSVGYQIQTATNGRDALRRLQDEGAQILISDWPMPILNEQDLCEAIRSNESIGFIYVIILTGRTEKENLLRAFICGADDFISKPFEPQELLLRLRAGARIVKLEAEMVRRSREIARQSADMAMLNSRLEKLATTDALTGLINRRQFISKIEELWRLSKRYSVNLSCILFDIDHFKKFNDTHGHAVGDAVLRVTAARMAKLARTVDVVARIGGEEFIVVCPNTHAAGAMVLAERLRVAMESEFVNNGGMKLQVTASMGIAERRDDHDGYEDLLRDADDALYAAKHAGRNCVRLFEATTAQLSGQA